jgi:hypothetical protein
MSKSSVWVLVIIGLIIIFTITNPKEQAHKDAVKSKITSVLHKNMSESKVSDDDTWGKIGEGLGVLFGGVIIDKLVDNFVSCNNCIIFSLTTVTLNDSTKIIGLGVLGNVFIFANVDDVLKDYNNATGEPTK